MARRERDLTRLPERNWKSKPPLPRSRKKLHLNHASLGYHNNAICAVSKTMSVLSKLWDDGGQDIAEYAIMMAVILAIVVGTIRLIGSNANNVFSSVASAVQ